MTDPRPRLRRALDQVGALVETATHLDAPTPCEGWDVRTLLGHLVTVERRLAHVARGGSPFDIPHVCEVPDGEHAAELADARADLLRVWADDAVLDRDLTLPWAVLPGRVAAQSYALELTAHAWDLAVATHRLDDLDPSLAEACLGDAEEVVPAEGREDIPFGPVVAVRDDADPYDRLVAWFGRDPRAVIAPR